MKLVYAPSFRESQDILHANVLCGYDISVLECLLEANNGGGGGRMKSRNSPTLKPRNPTIKSF
ncbi:hypothetical protein [Helicobacter sp.]|uniref:hypothetical protein n=1 Tax=Helicobacter sp. TaxID=218 RepID=UPI002A911DFD|nr:hypothetical protein [Helicobacter sp.]MDY5556922.1 hypothetical protein [Helicobacter sp.]